MIPRRANHVEVGDNKQDPMNIADVVRDRHDLRTKDGALSLLIPPFNTFPPSQRRREMLLARILSSPAIREAPAVQIFDVLQEEEAAS